MVRMVLVLVFNLVCCALQLLRPLHLRRLTGNNHRKTGFFTNPYIGGARQKFLFLFFNYAVFWWWAMADHQAVASQVPVRAVLTRAYKLSPQSQCRSLGSAFYVFKFQYQGKTSWPIDFSDRASTAKLWPGPNATFLMWWTTKICHLLNGNRDQVHSHYDHLDLKAVNATG